MDTNIKQVLRDIENYGYSENYGLNDGGAQQSLPSIATNYTVNPAIQRQTAGCSTSQITITVAKTGTGSGNTKNPVFLFGGDAYSNASKGYTAVQINSPNQETANAYTNGKNVITFKYVASAGVNESLYTVSQSTAGEYPFWLNQLTGDKTNIVMATQLTLDNAADVAQLNNTVKQFTLDQFGKADTNDLTQPKDLYQQQTNGLWWTNPFEISGKKGIIIQVNETNAMVLNLFMYVKPKPGCGC